jgi:DNA-binding beta-propeller fold protein YncE
MTRRITLLFLLPLVAVFSQGISRSKIGTSSTGTGEVTLKLIARKQSYNAKPTDPSDAYETAINSPKSVVFSADGKKFYVHSLEGHKTGVFETGTWKKIKEIRHHYTKENQHLFLNGETTVFDYPYYGNVENKNVFEGKPVESCLSHGGKYLWVTYYRRSYDKNAQCPSALAIIDTQKDEIVRVMPTGPLPKMIACSPNNEYIAVTHWGDNTVGIIDIKSEDPSSFKYIKHCIVDSKLNLDFSTSGKIDRDAECGNCLRGTTFSPDGQFLMVGKMGGSGGIAFFDTRDFNSLGTVTGMYSNLRHLVISGEYLYLSANSPGYVQRTSWRELTKFRVENSGTPLRYEKWESVNVGTGARTISLTQTGDYLFAAVNNLSKVVGVKTNGMQKVLEIPADSYPVGMSASPDGQYLIVTAQGKNNGGGNSVMIYQISYKQ